MTSLLLLIVLSGIHLSIAQHGEPCTHFIERARCRMESFPPGVRGYVSLTHRQPCALTTRVHVRVNIYGIPADDVFTRHGFHIHQHGNLTGGCPSTGGHYNPGDTDHGSPHDDQSFRHLGDMGNVVKNRRGKIRTNFFANTDVLLNGPTSVIGRAIVLHAGEDDLGNGGNAGSRATGNARGRLACCVIEQVLHN